MITGALRHLGVIARDEPVQAEDLAYAGDLYDGIFYEMYYVEELDVGEEDSIPDERYIPLMKILASDVAPHYGLVGPSRPASVMMLRQACAPVEVTHRVKGEYF